MTRTLSSVLGLALVVALEGCGGGDAPAKKDDAPAPKPSPAASPAKPKDPFQGERTEIRQGSRAALLYTWRDNFPRELAVEAGKDPWLIASAEYLKTQDLADAWSLVYAPAKGGEQRLHVAVVEYAGSHEAEHKYEEAVKLWQDRSASAKDVKIAVKPLEGTGAERATAISIDPDGEIATAVWDRYFFALQQPGKMPVLSATVKALVASLDACIHPKPSTQPGDAATVGSPAPTQEPATPKEGH